MSRVQVSVLSAPETAALLRQALGPAVAWDDWLSDRRRDRGDPLADFLLLPCAYIQERCRRPVYAVKDIIAFIESFRERHTYSLPKTKPKVRVIELDTEDHRSWKMKPCTPLGSLCRS
jgi:hypothetical protein